ncbi:MAG: outer membrane protein assembly factor BamA, partial [Candidatus Omnitrophica bacterium]|nr:outer membrane protein assembly factor BamA [Candidatus Omnitrophota bacterium]
MIEGQILDRKAVKLGVVAIQKLYGDKGFRFVDVQSEVDVNRETKEATVYIRVLEGEKYKIKQITLEGVQAFKPKKIRRLMKTKEDKWYTSGVFKETVFEKDIEKIRFFYQQEGYLDVKIQPSFKYAKDERKIFITVAVEEGRHYVTGEIKIKGNQLFPESEIWQQLEMLPGLTYSQYYLSKDIEKIRDYYNERGYMDARIVPDIKLNRESGKVDVAYEIHEGDLYFVEKVVIRGNTKTKDLVIRRELRIRPGDRFDGEKIKKSKQRLDNLGYFEEVTYDTEPSAQGTNRKDLIFRVKEKRTGELSFGGGISSVESFLGFAEISQRNFDLFNWPRFTGGGQTLAVRGQLGTINQEYTVSFVEPYLFNKPVSLGLDLYNTTRDDRNVDFDEERRGVGAILSRLFRDVYRVGTGYKLERVKLDDISEDAPQTVLNSSGSTTLSRWQIFNTYDTRDNVFNPTRGLLASLSGELIGSFLGGDED